MPLCKGRAGGPHRTFFDTTLLMLYTEAIWRDLTARHLIENLFQRMKVFHRVGIHYVMTWLQ